MPRGQYVRTEEHKRKISEARKKYYDEVGRVVKIDQRLNPKEYFAQYQKIYMSIPENRRKASTRITSSFYLFETLGHTRIKDYHIHHCFGYDDYKHFIYMPRDLHTEIHKFLRKNNISADSNHFSQIEPLISNYLEHNNKHILILKKEKEANMLDTQISKYKVISLIYETYHIVANDREIPANLLTVEGIERLVSANKIPRYVATIIYKLMTENEGE